MDFALTRTATLDLVSLHHVPDATQQAETLPRIPPTQDHFLSTILSFLTKTQSEEFPVGGEAAIVSGGGVSFRKPPRSNVLAGRTRLGEPGQDNQLMRILHYESAGVKV
jgi:hypothetical protein